MKEDISIFIVFNIDENSSSRKKKFTHGPVPAKIMVTVKGSA